jgi:arylsulfatase A-like enzyme
MKYSSLFKYAALGISIFSGCEKADRVDSPNVVIIFIDDEGYGDVGCFGASGFDTPNLDQMASQGMRFTNFYSGSAVCSASRAALLTGCYPPRVGILSVLMPDAKIGLNPDETIIPEMLKEKGYVSAIIGKWHLGDNKKFMPLKQGFDEYFGLPYSNDMWPVHYNGLPVSPDNYLKEWKLTCKPLALYEGNEIIDTIATLQDQDQLTTRYTERAIDFIKKNKNNPFLLYLPHTMGHVPLGVSDKFRGKSQQGLYGDVMMEIDWSVGEILKTLKDCKIDKNTLVIFATDNGPWLNYGNHAGSAGSLREGKNTVFEGGFRVPCIMIWPDVIPEGTVCNEIAGSIDILPTLADITGATLPENKIDGLSFLSLLNGDFQDPPRHDYFFYTDQRLNAVRLDNWKLVLPHNFYSNIGSIVGKDGWPGEMNRASFEGGLYNMRRDPGERYNVKEVYPEIAEKLEKMAEKMRVELGDANMKITGKENRLPGRITEN